MKPLVESKYRVLTDRNNRAIGGPVDGRGPVHVHRAAQSGSVRIHRGFSGGGDRAEWEKADPAMLNQKLKVLWIGCGTEDPGYKGVKAMDDLLTSKT